MSDDGSQKPDESARADKARWRWFRRWLLKLAGWFFAMTLVVIAITGLVAAIAWHHFTGVANTVIARVVSPYRVELGKVDITRRGLVHLESVRFLPPRSMASEGDAPWVYLDAVDLTYDFDELRNERRFRTLTLRSPEILINDASLERLGITKGDGGIENESESEGIPDLDFLGRIAERVEVTNGDLVIDTSRAPRLKMNWDLSVPAVNFADEEWINQEPLALRLKNIRIGAEGELGTIEKLEARGRLASNFQQVEIALFELTSPSLQLSPEWLAKPTAVPESNDPSPGKTTPSEEKSPDEKAFELLWGAFRVRNADISLSGFQGQSDTPELPDLSFHTSIDWRDFRMANGTISASQPLTLTLNDLVVDGRIGKKPDSPPAARLDKLTVKFDPAELLENRSLISVKLTEPHLYLTPGTTARFLSSDQTENEDREPDKKSGETPDETEEWSIGSFVIEKGQAEIRDWEWNQNRIPAASFSWDLDLRELSPELLAGQGKDPEQKVTIEGLTVSDSGEIDGPDSGKAILSVSKLAARFKWGQWKKQRIFDSLTVERPLIDLTDERLPDWVADFSFPTEPATTEKSSDSEKTPGPPIAVRDLSIEQGTVHLDTRTLNGRLPKLQSTFGITTENDGYRLHFQNLRVRSRQGKAMPESPESTPPDGKNAGDEAVREVLGGLFPQIGDPETRDEPAQGSSGKSGAVREQDVAFVRDLSIDFSAEGLQRDRRVKRIEVKGAEFQVGQGMKQMADSAGNREKTEEPAEKKVEEEPNVSPVPESDQQAAAKGNGWRVEEFVVTESLVRFESLIPQIEGLEFGIETKLKDIPLDQAGLLSQDSQQKVELAGIEIRDPYDSFITVAFLPTIFVEFSFAGLLQQRIDKIDLISPSIHVGQGLFWWIDYQRNYRKQNEGAGFGIDGNADPPPPPEEGDGENWEIRQINAKLGKIVIAPTGRPIGIVPFPFNASTNMDKGEIALKLEIPREQQYVYRFPDLGLELFGLEGDIEFNVPIQQEDNNLVQTFELERAMWKQYEVEKLYLTVTYDEQGVYGRFGGEAYGGYAEGQFNFYLDDVGVWDGWIAGTEMDMKPITGIVTPENFVMDGKINARLVSEGKGLELGETWGEIDTLSPGRIDFTKIDEMIQNLPDGWSQMKRSATQLSLETLKQFDYERGRGDLQFMNRDGWLRLDLEGPAGSRLLELYAHDWRKKPPSEDGSNPPAQDSDAESNTNESTDTKFEKESPEENDGETLGAGGINLPPNRPSGLMAGRAGRR